MRLQVVPVGAFGAEDVCVATSGPDEGCVFTGTEDGAVFRVAHDGSSVTKVADTGGRPLGIEWTADGRLVVCDARRGLLAVDPASGAVEELTGTVDGRPMTFCNNAAVAADGTVYFSDSSAVHPIDRWKAEMLELTGTGRLLRRATDGTVTVVGSGLDFANGVALAADESWVVVAETSRRRLTRYRLTGPDAGRRETFADDLPGYPDNLARGGDGLVWVACASPRDGLVEALQRGPLWLRRTATRIPDALQPAPRRTVRVLAYDGDGRLVQDVAVDKAAHGDAFHMVTGVREHDGRLWVGSLHEPAVAVLTR